MSVGIVLISHSHELVEGLRKILHQIQPEVEIAIAGGTEENEIGTSAIKIKQAIEKADSESGVAVLFDLGSALLNAQLAVELLETNTKVAFCDAPLVEGAYTAVIEAGIGSSLEEVVKAAESVKEVPKLL
ncbi:PTS-dependent dihydroxyacetone kinase phosphotransferase subunit DhaM [Neobacillus sp. YIM B02564]|uniref:phosphoenolpyruvate--glycerone phosphotransferase n=1 Tax=Neobacillus paridis TaxID=2803862 RepID=A0ABS1TU81_9BACI|nr:dihydroxyacetone kinase phosphoryl donor subunit DhaM [Neobacillus paridis]MBL4954604.1 PTS-dependent dihydroxyacetone kinase phosphotransferase subunit DhaM [Neobacillus paridis]